MESSEPTPGSQEISEYRSRCNPETDRVAEILALTELTKAVEVDNENLKQHLAESREKSRAMYQRYKNEQSL